MFWPMAMPIVPFLARGIWRTSSGCGCAALTTNLIAKLPAGSTVTLNWGDVGSPNSGNPTIDIFTAADPDGGIGYLTNETFATDAN